MAILLFVLLLAGVAWLSRPGIITRLPLVRRSLSIIQGIVVQRALAIALMIGVVLWQITQVSFTMTTSALVAIGIILVVVPPLAFLIVQRDRNDTQSLLSEGLRYMTPLHLLIYVVITCLYMALYEILLRGVLLHYLTAAYSVIVAVLLNTLIYAVMHLFKNIREALLSIPLGVFLCWITLYTRSIWPAVFFHSAMALSFEVFYSRKEKYDETSGSTG